MLAAMQMADDMQRSPLAVRYTKELMVRGADLPLEEALRLEDDITPTCSRLRIFKKELPRSRKKESRISRAVELIDLGERQ